MTGVYIGNFSCICINFYSCSRITIPRGRWRWQRRWRPSSHRPTTLPNLHSLLQKPRVHA